MGSCDITDNICNSLMEQQISLFITSHNLDYNQTFFLSFRMVQYILITMTSAIEHKKNR